MTLHRSLRESQRKGGRALAAGPRCSLQGTNWVSRQDRSGPHLVVVSSLRCLVSSVWEQHGVCRGGGRTGHDGRGDQSIHRCGCAGFQLKLGSERHGSREISSGRRGGTSSSASQIKCCSVRLVKSSTRPSRFWVSTPVTRSTRDIVSSCGFFLQENSNFPAVFTIRRHNGVFDN